VFKKERRTKMLRHLARLQRPISTAPNPFSFSTHTLVPITATTTTLFTSTTTTNLGSSTISPLSFGRRHFSINKAAGHRNVGRSIGNRVVAPEQWHHIDAKGQVVGRLATEIVTLLTGKHKPTYLPHIDSGDHVVVTNARHIVFTGNKETDKLYRWHTGFPGGLKEKSVKEMLETKPEDVLRRAVNGMLAKNRLRKLRGRKLRIFADEDHPHQAQLSGKLNADK
jgi:large subunit ribosomal protein L13